MMPAVATARSTQLIFTPVTLDAVEKISRLLRTSRSRSCDFTVGGIFMWAGLFDYEYCITQDTLFIKGLNEDGSGSTAFMLPVGALPLSRSVELLRDYCRRRDIPLVFTAVPDDRLAELTACAPCRVEELVDWADYVYDAEALATLTGKAYNKKRNHVNRFISDNPDYRLEEITPYNIGEVRTFFESLGIESVKADPDMADYEWQRCADVLANYGAYGFEGALLRENDGRIVAFTMGEISGDTLVLHIEKIEHLVAGAGESINKLFAEHMVKRHPGLRYINREDDAGDPGLRHAKESYHPSMMVRKYNVEIMR